MQILQKDPAKGPYRRTVWTA